MQVSFTRLAAAIVALASLVLAAACVPPSRRLPPVLAEASGLLYRPSPLGPIAINDGGNPAALHDPFHASAAVAVAAPNRDWEALAYLDSARRVCVCDVGDNARARESFAVYLIDEAGTVDTLVRRYAGGPRDAEACYVHRGELYVATKARTGRRPRRKTAYLYRVPLHEGAVAPLAPVDSLSLDRRAITGASTDGAGTLYFVAYDFDFALGLFPYTRTSVGSVSLKPDGRLDHASLRLRAVRAPFTLTQYEAIDVDRARGELVLLSERTAWWPPRWRRVAMP